MRIIFMGTPPFAVTAAQSIHSSGQHEIIAVYTQPPRPAGRGLKLTPSAMHVWAEGQGIPVYTAKSLKNAVEQTTFADFAADIAVVAAYGLILPSAILQAPRLGCLNIHASLLPRWRGAAPIQRAIMAGDAETGITIMQMDEGLDTGAMLAKASIPILEMDTTATLHDKLAMLGGRLLLETLNTLSTLTPIPQPMEGVTYAAKIDKSETMLNFTRPALELERQIRAIGGWFVHQKKRIKVLEARAVNDALHQRTDIPCSTGFLRLIRIQEEGGKARLVSEGEMIAFPQ